MKMATGAEPPNELSDIAKDLEPGPVGKENSSSAIIPNGTNPTTENSTGASLDVDKDIEQNPEKFFETLSSKIEDQLRMLEWEMTSNFQEVAISDFIGNKPYDEEDDPFVQNVSGGYFEIGNSYHARCPDSQESAQGELPERSRDISTRSSISSISSFLNDDDDKTSDIGADGDVENNTSESSRSGSCDSGRGGILAASIMLVETDRGHRRNVDSFISNLVVSIMRDISTIFSDDRDAILWTSAYDSNIVPTLSTSFNQYYNETDRNFPPDSREVLFSKTFTGDQVTFTNDRWFPHDEIFQYSSAGSHRLQDQTSGSTSVVRRRHRRTVGSDRSDEPERRIFHRARFQMHDIQHELRRLSCRLHDIKDDRADSSDPVDEK